MFFWDHFKESFGHMRDAHMKRSISTSSISSQATFVQPSLESSWGCRLHGNGRHSHRHGSVGWIWLWNWDILFDHSSAQSQGWPALKYTFMYCSCGHWCDHKCTKWRSYWIHKPNQEVLWSKRKLALGHFLIDCYKTRRFPPSCWLLVRFKVLLG